ncbi:uncharacterized protein LOC111366824 [Olea europaea var. sylvestris]|uniref:uncharacterized protein LOC111366824 n=1 Tax=Olea europaea var. sylvestris TaxID=158386 RepID=UPI000C1D7D8E|nr:uncharacterized protein LOC111366824 [Olea europaea var. sylvestris]
MSLEDMLKSLNSSTMQFQQETKISIKNLQTQVSQLANMVGKLEAQGSKNFLLKQSTREKMLLPFAKSKRGEHEKEILETFRKIQVNIPLLDAIYQVPRYAKLLKELCTNKHILKDNKVVSVGENVLIELQKKLLPKCKDPGSFTIPCIIGNTGFEKAMLHLGASINVMPYSIYAFLNLGSLKETGVIIQLADRSNAFPNGVLGDVLVQVNQLIFRADFYVLDMQDKSTSLSPPLLLERSFMRIVRTKIDVHNGILTTTFDGETIRFNIFETMRYSSDVHACFPIDIMDSLRQKISNYQMKMHWTPL